MKTNLYTFILDYDGCTAISQFRGENAEAARRAWIDGISIAEFKTMGFKEKHRAKIRARFELREMGFLNGVTNVWCCTFLVKKRLGLLNIVLTVD